MLGLASAASELMLWPSCIPFQPADAGALTSRGPLMLIPKKDPDLSSRLRLAACVLPPTLHETRVFRVLLEAEYSDAYRPASFGRYYLKLRE